MRQPIWCPSWCFLFLAFTRNGVSLTSAWGWKRSIGVSQRGSLLVTAGASDSPLSFSKNEDVPRGGATLDANATSSLHMAGEVAVEDPAEVSIWKSFATVRSDELFVLSSRIDACSKFLSRRLSFFLQRTVAHSASCFYRQTPVVAIVPRQSLLQSSF